MSKKDLFLKIEAITPAMAEELADHYSSLEELSLATPKELSQVLGVSLARSEKILSAVREHLAITPISAAELLKKDLNTPTITTFSQNLDEIFDGGIPVGSMVEFSGSFGTGKTQLSLQLCLTVQFPEELGGIGKNAYFIDAEGTFSAKRLLEMASAPDLPVDGGKSLLNNVYRTRALNAEHLIDLVQNAGKMIKEKDIGILIVDSVASHFRAEFLGKETLPQRQQLLMKLANYLQRLAENFNVAVVVTNQILANPDAIIAGSTEPALGFAWGHRPTHRVFLRKARGNMRVARIFDSPYLPDAEAMFYITSRGIRDKDVDRGEIE